MQIDFNGNEKDLSMILVSAERYALGRRTYNLKEVWKDIKGYEGLYQVSNMGKIKSLKFSHGNKEKILKGNKEKFGYLVVTLYKNKGRKNFKIHRLVAETFIPNPKNLPQVNHIDGNKQNNRIDNLEWCTAKENTNHAHKTGLANNDNLKIKVKQYDLNGNFIREWDSITDIEKSLNIDKSSVVKVCRHKRNQAGGYVWDYNN